MEKFGKIGNALSDLFNLNLSFRLADKLKKAGIISIQEIEKLTDAELMEKADLTDALLSELHKCLNQYYLALFPGKKKCELLRQIRREIAGANGIIYLAAECTYKGPCKGTCPACDAEIKYLENELNKKVTNGERITLSGISLDSFNEYLLSQSTVEINRTINPSKDQEDKIEMGNSDLPTYFGRMESESSSNNVKEDVEIAFGEINIPKRFRYK